MVSQRACINIIRSYRSSKAVISPEESRVSYREKSSRNLQEIFKKSSNLNESSAIVAQHWETYKISLSTSEEKLHQIGPKTCN